MVWSSLFRESQRLRYLDATNYGCLHCLFTGENRKCSFSKSVLLRFDFHKSLGMVGILLDRYFVDIIFQALRHLV